MKLNLNKTALSLGVVVISLALLGAGCAKGKDKPEAFGPGQKAGLGQMGQGMNNRFLGFVTSTIAEVKVGSQVMVMGAANADQSITATDIILGTFAMPSSTFKRPETATGTVAANTANNQPQGQWQARDGQERGQARSGSNVGAGTKMPRKPGANNVRGEVLKIDTNSLIIKAADGGSRLVYFTDSTTVRLAPTSTPPVAGVPASPTTTEVK